MRIGKLDTEKLSLQTKVMLSVALGLLLLFGIVAFLGFRAMHQSTERSLEEHLAMGQLVADNIDHVLNQELRRLKNTVNLASPAVESGDLAAQEKVFQAAYPGGGITTDQIILLDSAGKVIWAEPSFPVANGSYLGGYAGIRVLLQDGSDARFAADDQVLSDRPLIILAVPVKDSAGGIRGALAGIVDPASPDFDAFMLPINLGKTGYSELVNSNGMVIARTEPGQALSPMERSDHADRFKTLLSLKSPVKRTCHRCHAAETGVETRQGEDVMAFVPLQTVSWGVAVRQSQEEALQITNTLRRGLVILGVLSLAASLGLALISTRRILRPVRDLTRASLRIADGDFNVAIYPESKDEIGQMAQSFDDMRRKLQAFQEDIKRQNVALESQAKELSVLLQASQKFTATLELDMVLHAIIFETRELFPSAHAGAIFLYDEEREFLVAGSSFGFKPEIEPPLVVKPGEDCVWQSFVSARPVICRPANLSIPMRENLSNENELRVRNVAEAKTEGLCVPLIFQSRPIGIMALYSFGRDRAFSDSAIPLLQSLVNQGAVIVRNAQLYQEAQLVGTLRELDRLKSEFIARASHELRTPLTAIKSSAETLLRKDLALRPTQRQQFLETINTGSDRLARMITELLTVSRIEAGRLDLQQQAISLPKVIEKVVQEFTLQTYHTFEVQAPPDLPLVWADYDRVQDVLHNLLSNAVRYAPAGSPVIIRAAVQATPPSPEIAPRDGMAFPQFVVVSLIDKGTGIAPADLIKLFQRFVQLNDPVSRKMGGIGLGLYICKTYVEAMGGRIWADSSPGEGSTFSFTIPLASSAQLQDLKIMSQIEYHDSAKPSGRLFLVDDDAGFVKTAKLHLSRRGFKTYVAATGEEFLSRVKRVKPDLVILDVKLPGIDGFEVVRRLRAEDATSDIPVVFLTARAQSEDEARGRELGAAAYLRKPVSFAILCDTAHAFLKSTERSQKR